MNYKRKKPLPDVSAGPPDEHDHHEEPEPDLPEGYEEFRMEQRTHSPAGGK